MLDMFTKEKMDELADNVDNRVLVQFFTMGYPVLTAGKLSEVGEFEFVEIREVEALIGPGLVDTNCALSGNFIRIPFISMGTAIQLIEDRESGEMLFENSFIEDHYGYNNPNIMNPVKVYSLIEIVFGPEVAEKKFSKLKRIKTFFEREEGKMEKGQFN